MTPKTQKQTGGRAPISEKSKKGPNIRTTIPGAPKSLIDVPAECMEELKKKGLEARWIDIVTLKRNHGYHKQDWKPYKFESLSSEKNPFIDNNAFEGYLVRKQLVLAAKPMEEAEAQRRYVKHRTNLQSNVSQKAVDEFKEFASKSKDMKVHGDDDEDEE